MGIIIPLVMWVLKREKIKLVDDSGKKLISFQITWTLVLYVVLMIATKGLYVSINFNLIHSFPVFIADYSIFTVTILFLYFYNIIFIILNIRRSKKGLKNKYVPAIPFLKPEFDVRNLNK
ncbi:DUF4870 domain-containing protein [Polaribacter sp. IC073]|uniref:DUF4870 domain-containing protein n=1 Tax=Polaribacter sp. IC073 TaxID=2508540 RepID=UPI001679B697|nr:DUF4870 domain-containing protein [Polaribacter sp. IC073]